MFGASSGLFFCFFWCLSMFLYISCQDHDEKNVFYQGFRPSKCMKHRYLQCCFIIFNENSLPHGVPPSRKIVFFHSKPLVYQRVFKVTQKTWMKFGWSSRWNWLNWVGSIAISSIGLVYPFGTKTTRCKVNCALWFFNIWKNCHVTECFLCLLMMNYRILKWPWWLQRMATFEGYQDADLTPGIHLCWTPFHRLDSRDLSSLNHFAYWTIHMN